MDNAKMKLRLIMPTTGDMELVSQEGGTIDLGPIFYGGESMGPHIQLLQGDKVTARFKLRLKEDGKLELKKAQ
jgi:hypothetical protein